MEVNKAVTNPKLLDAIREMKVDSSKEKQFFKELSQARFLCPAKIDLKNSPQDEEGNVIAQGGSRISLISISDNSGKNYLLAFTDWKELEKWNKFKRQQALILPYEDYQGIILENSVSYEGVVINPYSDNVVLNKEMIKNLGSQNIKVEKGESVMIGLPKDYPTKMVEMLKSYFKEAKVVNEAYLLWMARGKDLSYLLVLDSEIPPQKLYPKVGELCQPYLKDKSLDMVPLRSDFGKNAIKNQQPFYKK